MLIRSEIGIDAASIDSLLRRSFPTSAEAELVQQLREDGLLTLGVVATDDDGQVLGYAAFSPVTLNDEDRQWVGLAPLAVDESVRRQGVGKQLIYEGLDTLNEFGYAAVVVLGDPAFYGPYGFEPAARHQLHCRWEGTEAAFQVYKLADDAFDGVEGRIEFSAPFNRF
ncbi:MULTISPECIES: GNAT family N-acetyltransferase [Erwinia]|uniref:N-acetyltransferase n=1 Tax=Erwinia rhapontici TaxID=55212 RepID=A0ABM7MVI3_ERWRD|nr:N-acetyltransferase [Erwinia rhapontici]MBP2153933.1 putative acetyltransferase [Erwinia rhapontici]MCS3606676.1 putative acetyltransferase [Erwinia rhapontici]NKG29143.1 N-acetyltransferase [Erwinia rhapontici]UDQ80802.1 N-acetyltransferase [Erwinia rhapontici]BCQ33202.1 N-acetyltransferase [Erwinia rhapontici]